MYIARGIVYIGLRLQCRFRIVFCLLQARGDLRKTRCDIAQAAMPWHALPPCLLSAPLATATRRDTCS